MNNKKTCEDTDKKFCHRTRDTKVYPIYWKKGDDGLKYKWNKIGEVKVYYFICPDCGNKQEFLPI